MADCAFCEEMIVGKPILKDGQRFCSSECVEAYDSVEEDEEDDAEDELDDDDDEDFDDDDDDDEDFDEDEEEDEAL